eukprot:1155081-Pelagomonas_calceolata.AAC.3
MRLLCCLSGEGGGEMVNESSPSATVSTSPSKAEQWHNGPYPGRSQEDIKQLRLGGMDVQETIKVPEIAFTADTTAEFLERDSPALTDALRARLLIIEMTFVDDTVSVDEVRMRNG